jgi:hypothetical protein
VIKLRFTTGGRGMAFVEDRDKLVEKCRVTRARHGAPMIQEYIPGPDLTENVFVVLGRDGRPVVATTVRVRRQNFAISGPATASQMAPLGAIGRKAIVLAQHINWWGGVTVQYKLDARDGQPKLMEINPRLGIQLWYRTEIGINEPLMCLQIARGESVEAVKDNPTGCLLLRPFEDLILRPLDFFILALHRFQSAVVKHRLMDPLARLSPTENRFSCYWNDYFGKRERRLEPYARYALADPLPLILWILKLLTSFLEGLTRKIGRRSRSFT